MAGQFPSLAPVIGLHSAFISVLFSNSCTRCHRILSWKSSIFLSQSIVDKRDEFLLRFCWLVSIFNFYFVLFILRVFAYLMVFDAYIKISLHDCDLPFVSLKPRQLFLFSFCGTVYWKSFKKKKHTFTPTNTRASTSYQNITSANFYFLLLPLVIPSVEIDLLPFHVDWIMNNAIFHHPLSWRVDFQIKQKKNTMLHKN